jgi:hypothetical protein
MHCATAGPTQAACLADTTAAGFACAHATLLCLRTRRTCHERFVGDGFAALLRVLIDPHRLAHKRRAVAGVKRDTHSHLRQVLHRSWCVCVFYEAAAATKSAATGGDSGSARARAPPPSRPPHTL